MTKSKIRNSDHPDTQKSQTVSNFPEEKKQKKKKKDYRFFCGLQLGRDLYRLVVCAFTRLIYLIAKGQSRNMLSLCCVRARIQWIFTSPLSQYLFFSAAALVCFSCLEVHIKPVLNRIWRFVPGKQFCLLFSICSECLFHFSSSP